MQLYRNDEYIPLNASELHQRIRYISQSQIIIPLNQINQGNKEPCDQWIDRSKVVPETQGSTHNKKGSDGTSFVVIMYIPSKYRH